MLNRTWLILLVAFTLLAASCGNDDTATADVESPDAGEAVATDDDVAIDQVDEGNHTTTSEPGTSSVPLTASHRGVTESVIRVGVLTYDWDRLSELGVDFGVSNSGDLYVAAIEAINDRGGVHGRLLEPFPVEFLPVGAAEADEACVRLTEDEEVFVVVGTTFNDQVLCFTELHETAVITAGGINAERQQRSIAPYASVIDTTEGRTANFVSLMESTGVLDDATVGVIGSIDVTESGFRAMASALMDAGFDPVEGLIGGNTDDLAASAREQGLIYQRMTEAGVDVTVSTTGVPLEIANALEAGYETDQWLLSTVMTGRGLTDAGVPHSYLDGALAVVNTPVGTSAQPSLADDPLASACIDDLIARTGHPLPYSLDPPVNDIGAGLLACSIATILEAALLNAGTVLTNDSFRQGLEGIGEIDLPGHLDASLGPDDMGAAKGLTVVEFDGTTGVWEPID